jgi:GNAT superfamily N-acetyltransferase
MLTHETLPGQATASECEAVLRALPEWFGIETALLEYVRDVASLPTWLWRADGELLAFLSIKRHFPDAAEIHVMGVVPGAHRGGLGRRLVEACEAHLRGSGCRFLQVKTLSASSPDPHYAKTRSFYEAMGFAGLEEFPTLWDEWNPCLLMVKALR